jgi:SanA protein
MAAPPTATRTSNPTHPVKAATRNRWLTRLKRLNRLILALLLLGIALIAYANITAVWASRGRIFSDPAMVPKTKVGLVFGTTDRVSGRENLYFRYRIDAATAVWKAGRIETLIVSGDNRTRYYNEPEKMRQALIEHGIPADRIVCDYAGLRTLDSVVRSKEIFGADTILFISQRFQNERAIYLAKANGIQAYGFIAKDVDTQAGMKTKLREVGARVKMWLDVNFLNTRPQHLGERIEMPE